MADQQMVPFIPINFPLPSSDELKRDPDKWVNSAITLDKYKRQLEDDEKKRNKEKEDKDKAGQAWSKKMKKVMEIAAYVALLGPLWSAVLFGIGILVVKALGLR